MIKNPDANIKYYLNENFDWENYESSSYVKYRYIAYGSCKADNCDIKVNCLVEWDKRSMIGLRSAIIDHLKENDNIKEVTDVMISNLIEVGYPESKENSNGRE